MPGAVAPTVPDGAPASAAPAADGQDGTGAPAPAAPPPDGSGAPASAAPAAPAADGQDGTGATPEPAAPGADSGDGTGAESVADGGETNAAPNAALAVPEGSQRSYQVTANSINAVLALLRGWGWG